jgi:hypothetical protein
MLLPKLRLVRTFAEKNAALKAAAKAPKTFLDTPEGEAAVKIYQDYLKSNLSEADARAKVNEISPGLGDRVAAAIAGGVPAAQPEPAKLSPAPPATLKAAQDAIAAGADQNAVVERLNKQGYNAEGL